ncbi:MAG TPA: glutaredoxin family protein [Casimicrobiaceae bacterium]|nr:glutaredoxin family protein [Casimicrobiaceae bacterium]
MSVPAAGTRAQLALLTRAYCHLCDTMRDALMPIARRHGATVVEFDVDADPALEAAYGDFVPVLLLGDVADGAVLCHFHLDRDRVVDALAGNPPAQAGGA